MGLIDHKFEDNFITTSIDRVLNWARESSIWPMGFGLACCAIEMMAAGASGYVPKRAAPEDLLTAIRAAHRGEVFLHPTLAKVLVRDFLARPGAGKGSAADGLTDREREVLQHLAEGAGNQAIADVLNISVNTVARHRENIMQKLKLHNRAELVKYAIRKGLISA